MSSQRKGNNGGGGRDSGWGNDRDRERWQKNNKANRYDEDDDQDDDEDEIDRAFEEFLRGHARGKTMNRDNHVRRAISCRVAC